MTRLRAILRAIITAATQAPPVAAVTIPPRWARFAIAAGARPAPERRTAPKGETK